MTQEIKDKLEQEATEYASGKSVSFTDPWYIRGESYKAGAQTILDNPGEWGLEPVDNAKVILAEGYIRLEAENQRLREALGRISTPIHGEYPDIETVNWIAKEALKNNEG